MQSTTPGWPFNTMEAGQRLMKTCDACKVRKVRCSGISKSARYPKAQLPSLNALQDIQVLRIASTVRDAMKCATLARCVCQGEEMHQALNVFRV